MFETMADVRAANKAIGHHWFSPGAKTFFRSRVGRTLYGGRYFISSEQFSERAPRFYTIREVSHDGQIRTVGTFQQYRDAESARKEIKSMIARGWGNE